MSELGVGYISIVPEVSKISPGIAKAIDASAPAVEKSGKGIGSSLAAGIGTTLKVGAGSAAAAAGGVIATGLTKGLTRLTALDSAQAKLEGLGLSSREVSLAMKSMNQSVKGTAFGLDEAASSAAKLVGNNVAVGDELNRTMTLTADLAAQAGTSMDDVSSIMAKAAGTGRVNNEILAQMDDRAIGASAALSKHLGVSMEEVRDLASKGSISFEDFQKSMEEHVGGAAQNTGKTVQGAASNMISALGRVGATALTPFFSLAVDGFGNATEKVDDFGERVKPLASNMDKWLNGEAIPAIKGFKSNVDEALASDTFVSLRTNGEAAFTAIVGGIEAVYPSAKNLAQAFTEASAALGITSWDIFTGALEVTGKTLQTVSPVLETVTEFLKEHPGLVAAGITAWTAYKTVPGVLGSITTAIGPTIGGIKNLATGFQESLRYTKYFNPEMGAVSASMAAVGHQSLSAVRGLGGLKGALSGIMGIFGGPWGVALMGAGAAIGALVLHGQDSRRMHEEVAGAALKNEEAHEKLRSTLAGTSGALGEEGIAAAAELTAAKLTEVTAKGEHLQKVMSTLTGDEEYLEEDYQGYRDLGKSDNDAKLLATKALKDGYEELKNATEELGISEERLNQIIATGGPEFENLKNHLNESGQYGEYMAGKLQRVNEEITSSIEAARNVNPEFLTMRENVRILADEASTADQKLSAMRDILDQLHGGTKSASEAMMEAAEATEQIAQKALEAADPAKALGEALWAENGALVANDSNARAMYDLLSGMGDELLEVAASGGDVQAAFADMQPVIQQIADEFGITTEEAKQHYQGLIDQVGLNPLLVEALIELQGAETAEQEVAAVQLILDSLEEEKFVDVGVLDEGAKAYLEETGYLVRTLPNGNIEIADNTGDIIRNIELLGGKASIIDGNVVISHNTPEVMGYVNNLTNEVTKDKHGNVIISDNAEQARQKVLGLDGLKTKGQHTQNTNADSAREGIIQKLNNLRTTGTHFIRTIFGGGGDERREANGSVRYAKSGWLSDQSAQIMPGGSWVTWAEDETQGESFIPHAKSKRKRSTQILAETAGIFGLGLVDKKGNSVERDGTSLAPAPYQKFYADGAVRSAGEIDAFAQGLEGKPYVWGGVNWGDCSGAMSAIARFAVGLAPFAGRFATGNMAEALSAMGFRMGRGPAGSLRFGWYNGGPYGGHTSGTLPSGVNVEMGGGRGNGQYGGPAAPWNHSQYTNFGWLPVSAKGLVDEGAVINSLNSQFSSGSFVGVDSGRYAEESSEIPGAKFTSVNGVSTKYGNVSWGEANKLYTQALEYVRAGGARLYDQGGVIPHGGYGRNESGSNELVLTNSQWRANSDIAKSLPLAADRIVTAADSIKEAAELQIRNAERTVVQQGFSLGGDYVGSAKIVQDAEKGLHDTRLAVAEEIHNISAAEEQLITAKAELAEVQNKDASLSESSRRKIEDAERNLAKAREEGKADKIAEAELRLKRAREDAAKALDKSNEKHAQDTKKAMENVIKAEEVVIEAREKNSDAAMRLEAAERAVAAARYEAIGEAAKGIFSSIGEGFTHISKFFDEMERLTKIVDSHRQAVSKLEMQQQMQHVSSLRALSEQRIASWNVAKVGFEGILSRAEAQKELDEAIKATQHYGEMGIAALMAANDHYLKTGQWKLREMTEEEIMNSQRVREAIAKKRIVELEAEMASLEASHKQKIATWTVAQATLDQTRTAEMLILHTQALTEQTRVLNGMTPGQASGAAKGFGGVGKIGSGIGKVAGGILAGLAGFAVGGPIGALLGAGMAVSGIGEIAKGASDVHNNKNEMKEAWNGMGTGSKATIVLGSLGGALAGVGGASLGIEGAQLGAQLGEEIVGATIGSLQYDIANRIETSERRFQDQLTAAERTFAHQQALLDLEKSNLELEFLRRQAGLDADLSNANLDLIEIEWAGSEEVINAIDEMRLSNESHRETMAAAYNRQNDKSEEANKLLARLVTLNEEANKIAKKPVTSSAVGVAKSAVTAEEYRRNR